MSNSTANLNGRDEDDTIPYQRPPSPPLHATFAVRGIHVRILIAVAPPTFSAFRPREVRFQSPQLMNHVAWSCDGRKLAAVGIDKVARVWSPEKTMEPRASANFSGAHSDDVDYVSWNPTHPELFCTSSQKDKRIVLWDGRQSRHVQLCQSKVSPVMTTYSPDGRTILFTSTGRHLHVLTYGKEGEETKEQWHISDRDSIAASTVLFNPAGDGIILTHQAETSVRALQYPSYQMVINAAAHVGGCTAAAFDPRGIYLATGGYDSIVNLFEISSWMCQRSITSCEHAINALSFSHDGEFLAVATAGPYVEICATETGLPLHRVQTSTPPCTVAWHPSKYVFAYCGQIKTIPREGPPIYNACINLFGPGM
ncbi:THO complex subunit 3 [Grifola frondosa]|uniref:THO complex subunit 3 n=1 Tax=Grifola frondosa TaxID=5627 RepID=A0A1C7LZB6_GRIFR|nr:THO complex subunit 3 [Grifola frondosa]